MLPSSGKISIADIANEMGKSLPDSLQNLVQASILSDKTAPFSLSDFYGYEHIRTIQFSIGMNQPTGFNAGGFIQASETLNTSLTIYLRVIGDQGSIQDVMVFMPTGGYVEWTALMNGNENIMQTYITYISPEQSGDERYW